MGAQPSQRRRSASAILLNLSAAICLSLLFGLGIFVSVARITFAWERSDGWAAVTSISPSTWNVAVVIIGTAVGILASIAVSSHDAFLSQLELASSKGVRAVFLRPLTAKRGLDQLLSRCMAPERVIVVLVLLVTALTSTATVALFSSQTTAEELTNDRPSFGVEALNMTFFRNWHHSVGVIGAPRDYVGFAAPALGSFMHRSAFVNGLIAEGYRSTPSDPGDYMPLAQDGVVGDVTYRGLWTAGVGINVRSYLEYPGPGTYFSLPANYTLNSLKGEVFGTIINATCENRTADYDRFWEKFKDLGDVILTTVTRRDGSGIQKKFSSENITVMSHLGSFGSAVGTLALGSNITLPSPGDPANRYFLGADEPLHTILVAGTREPLGQVFECRYSGHEVLVEVSLPSPLAPLEIGRVRSMIRPISPAVKQLVVKELHRKMDLVARGFRDAHYNTYAHETTPLFAETLAVVLSQSAQAAISLMRQMIEVAHLYNPPSTNSTASVTATITIQRLGGGNRGWLAVYGILLLGALFGLLRVSVGGTAVEFEAQDAGLLLAKATGDEEFGPATMVQFVPGTGLIWGGRTEGLYVLCRHQSEQEYGQADGNERITGPVLERKGVRRGRRYTC